MHLHNDIFNKFIFTLSVVVTLLTLNRVLIRISDCLKEIPSVTMSKPHMTLSVTPCFQHLGKKENSFAKFSFQKKNCNNKSLCLNKTVLMNFMA